MATQLILPLRWTPLFDDAFFCVSPSNDQAFSLVTQWPNWPSSFLAIWGERGCGKTHLGVLAWRKACEQTAQGKWCASLSEFAKLPLPEGASAQSLYVVECSDWNNPTLYEKAFFSRYEEITMISRSTTVLLLCSQPPARWPVALPDTASRLASIVAVPITPPDDSLLHHIALKCFRDRGISPSPSVMLYLHNHGPRALEPLQNLIYHVCSLMLQTHRPLTVPLLKEALQRLSLLC